MRRPQPVKLSGVVTKGHIRVVSKPGLQVVASAKPEVISFEAQAAAEPVASQQPAAVQPVTSSWKQGFAQEAADAQPVETETLLPPGHSMKLIKLIAAAAVLGIAAIALTFLQFSGSGEAANSQNLSAIQRFNPVISAAGASPLTDAASVPEAASGTQDSSALVAQITAGTLAALRSTSAQTAQTPAIPANVSGSGAAAASPVVTGEANGLYAMVLAALQQGQSTQYIDQMVNDAYRNQQVAVPAVLLTASGEVNTPALLTLFGGQ